MSWSTRSPDLSPNAHVSDGLGKNSYSKTRQELKSAILDELTLFSQTLVDTILNKVKSRSKAFIVMYDGHTQH